MRFFKDEEGVVMIEYALIAALIGVALIITLIALKNELNNIFMTIVNALVGAQTP
jgi:Flp pilus assembly pilin Flp